MQRNRRLLLCRLTPILRGTSASRHLRQTGQRHTTAAASSASANAEVTPSHSGSHPQAQRAAADNTNGPRGFASAPLLSVASRLKQSATSPGSGAASAAKRIDKKRASAKGQRSAAAAKKSVPPLRAQDTLRDARRGQNKGEKQGGESRDHAADREAVGEELDVDELLAGVSTTRTIPPPHNGTASDKSRRSDRKGEEVVVFDELDHLSTTPPAAPSPSSSPPPQAPPPAHAARRLSDLSPLELTRRALNIGETVTSGAATTSLERIERRRSKYTVSDAEFEVGITERLFPEIRRLPALHELHYGDATVREVDSHLYFNARTQGEGLEAKEQTNGVASSQAPAIDTATENGAKAEAVEDGDIKDDADVVVGEDDDDDDAFAAFDAETQRRQSASTPAPNHAADTFDATKESERDAEEAHGLVLPTGSHTPWFIQRDVAPMGALHLRAIPPSECLALLQFLLKLRNQTLHDLPKALQRKADAAARVGTASDKTERSTNALAMSDIIKYLDSAPAPVMGLTESLYDPLTGQHVSCPAFVFTLYMENVSFSNASAHLASLFGLPIRSFHAHSVPSKMACATILCSVASNALTREHLLLINTLRWPGFVLRVSDIREAVDHTAESVVAEAHHTSGSNAHEDAIAGELARWDVLYETEVLLRRISGKNKQEIETRLRAAQQVGAVFYTATREASLARAATDLLHGFYKSAVVNALHRPRQPKEMKEFLSRPNVVTASRARGATTDATVRQVLRAFTQTNGNWQETVRRVPYHFRHRWLNALRSLVWNKMASQRLRVGGRAVLVGDAVVRPEFRADVQRRMITTLTTEHIKVIETPEEAAACSLEDVFIPFLRGSFPPDAFAPESSQHPIMTESSMLALLRENHAPQLLLGLPEEARLLLDVRGDRGALLWRRFIIRPVDMQFRILEDKAPMKSVHFDAARLLGNDRWRAHPATAKVIGTHALQQQQQRREASRESPTDTAPDAAKHTGAVTFPSSESSLLPQSYILEQSTIGARLSSGYLAEEFFEVPSSDHYVVLGASQRNLGGSFVPATPQTPSSELQDRLYTVYIHAITRTGVAGVTQVLREYFILAGVEQERDSALQHKVHRIRRELDPETPLLTAPTYCTVCYNRDHEDEDTCAEYLFKRQRHTQHSRTAMALAATTPAIAMTGEAPQGATTAPSLLPPSSTEEALTANATESKGVLPSTHKDDKLTVCLSLQLHRRQRQKWGVNLTSALKLTGLDDPSLVKKGSVAVVRGGADASRGDEQAIPWPKHLLESLQAERQRFGSAEEAQAVAAAAADAAKKTKTALDGSAGDADDASGEQPLRVLEGLLGLLIPEPVLRDAMSSSASPVPLQLPVAASVASPTGERNGSDAPSDPFGILAAKLPSPRAAAGAQTTGTTTGGGEKGGRANALLRACNWRLTRVNEEPVATPRDVARVFVTLDKQLDVRMTFAATLTVKDAKRNSSDRAEVTQPCKAVAVTPEIRRWLRELPDTLHVVLTKTVSEATSKDARVASWGVRLHTRDMTLVNFSQLLSHALGRTPRDTPQQHPQPLHVKVSLTPTETLAQAQQLFGGSPDRTSDGAVLASDVFVALVPALDAMYNLTRMDGVVVTSRQAVGSTLHALKQRVARGGTVSADAATANKRYVHLPLVLKRRPDSYTATFGEAAPPQQRPDGPAPIIARDASRVSSVTTPAKSAIDSPQRRDASVMEVAEAQPASLVPCIPHQPVMTVAQRHNSLATIAVNRLAVTPQTVGRWGLKIQRGTCRLKHIQFNHSFTFEVFVARRNHAVRMQDTLRYLPPSSSSSAARHTVGSATNGRESLDEETESESAVAVGHEEPLRRRTGRGGVKVEFAYYAYFITAVNHEKVSTFEELRDALKLAALPETFKETLRQQQQQRKQQHGVARETGDSSDGVIHDTEDKDSTDDATAMAAAMAQGPESVTLNVKQYALMRLTAVVRRGGGPDEPSPLAPVGLSINNSLVVLSVEPGSPMATAILQATGEASSLRRLIGRKASASPFSHTQGKGRGMTEPAGASGSSTGAAGSGSGLANLGSHVVVAPILAEALEKVLTAAGTPTTKGTVAAEARKRRAWQYEMDEDHPSRDAAADTQDASSDRRGDQVQEVEAMGQQHKGSASTTLPERYQDVQHALEALSVAAQRVQAELAVAVAVDAVHVMQASLLADFALGTLRSLRTHMASPHHNVEAASLPTAAEDTLAALPAELARLLERLEEVHEEVCWRVLHATKSGTPLRTTQEVANVLAPGVAEEGLVLQQCLVTW